MIIEEDVWYVFHDDLSNNFHQARENFLKKDFKAAAAKMRKGVAVLKVEANRAEGEAKKALEASVHELDKLATDVEKGAVKSAKHLDDAFARAHHALAKHYLAKSQEAEAKKWYKRLGHYMKAAVTHLEHALAWSGHKTEAAVVKVIDETRLLSGKLIDGTGWAVDEVGKGTAALGKEIEKAGHLIEPHEKKK